MKWYAKQVAALTKKEESKKSSPVKSKGVVAESITLKKIKVSTPKFVNPVKMRNVNRPKTDSK